MQRTTAAMSLIVLLLSVILRSPESTPANEEDLEIGDVLLRALDVGDLEASGRAAIFDSASSAFSAVMANSSSPVPSISFGGLGRLAGLAPGIVVWARRRG